MGAARLAERKACGALREMMGERAGWVEREEKAKAEARRARMEAAAAGKDGLVRERELAEELRAARAHVEQMGMEVARATALAQASGRKRGQGWGMGGSEAGVGGRSINESRKTGLACVLPG